MKKITVFSAVLLGAAMIVPYQAFAAYEAIANPKEVVSTLNHLVERAIDGQKGFEEAAQHTLSADLKARFAPTNMCWQKSDAFIAITECPDVAQSKIIAAYRYCQEIELAAA